MGVINWLRDRKYWVVFILLQAAGFMMLFQGNRYRSSILFTQANTMVATILKTESNWLSYLDLVETNRVLTERNVIMQKQITELRQAVRYLQHDSTESEKVFAKSLKGLDLVSAQVIGNSIRSVDNTLVIDKGTEDGVREEMGVVCGTGIVGIVIQAGKHSSVVMSILNSQSSIACRIRSTDYFGYLRWQGGNPLLAVLEDVPTHARFKVGDAIETSGYSNIFPAGIFVGRILKSKVSRDGQSYKLYIQLSTDMARLRDVCVIK